MKFSHPGKHWRAGFTLIELLVVVAIIGILASLLLSAVSGAKTKAKRIQCQNRLRQVCLASEMYRMDHNQRFMQFFWEERLATYVPSKLVRHAPGVEQPFYNIFECTGPPVYFKSLQWSIQGAGSPIYTDIRWPVRFGFNAVGLGWVPLAAGGPGHRGSGSLSTGLWNLPDAMVRAPANCIQFGDSTEFKKVTPNSRVTPRTSWTDGRHGDRSLMAFVDSHIEAAPWSSWREATIESRQRWTHDNQHHPELQHMARF